MASRSDDAPQHGSDETADDPAVDPAVDRSSGEPLAEADPATEGFPAPAAAPVDHLDPATPVEDHHHETPAEPARSDDEVGEPTEMMSFDDLAAGYDQDQTPEQTPDVAPAEPGAWEPAEAAPQEGPPPAPDFGSGAAPVGAPWSPPPAPSNPFAPAGGEAPGGRAEQAHDEQPAPYDAPPQQDGGWGRPDPAPGWEEPAAAPAPGWGDPGQGGHDDVDHDGDTRAGEYDPEVYARSQPGIPGQPPAPSVTSRPVARLMMSHGESVDVDRAVLVGRAPEARRFTATEQPRLVTVPSPNQEISSTHLEVRPGSGADHGSAVVTDMGSTNGTVLVQPGLAPEDLQPGIAVQLIPGAVIDLGDGLTIQVANP